MKRGFFSGLVWGALSAVIVIVVGLVFQSYERIQMPEAEAFEVPAGSEFTRSREDQAASLPAPVEAPQQLAKPPAEAPQPAAPDVAPDEDVASATVPKSAQNKLTGLSTGTLPQTETNLPALKLKITMMMIGRYKMPKPSAPSDRTSPFIRPISLPPPALDWVFQPPHHARLDSGHR